MNKKQNKIIRELKNISNKLGHSVKRRDCKWKLYLDCVKEFSSFNNAKQKAGLNIRNLRISSFPKKAFKLNKDMARIASYLTFDGHLYKDLGGFYFSSKNINDLKEFEKITKRKFGLSGKYYKNPTPCFYVFNKEVSTRLFNLGIPKGEKVTQKFNVPNWILNSKEFSREYLKIAFLCEGCMKEGKRKNPRININTAKIKQLLDSGIKFMETLKLMLKRLGIKTTKTYITGKRVRKRDGKVSKDIRFRIITEDNNKFIKEIGWIK